jgi:hypothetical protein
VKADEQFLAVFDDEVEDFGNGKKVGRDESARMLYFESG